jgi:hypothetical protein
MGGFESQTPFTSVLERFVLLPLNVSWFWVSHTIECFNLSYYLLSRAQIDSNIVRVVCLCTAEDRKKERVCSSVVFCIIIFMQRWKILWRRVEVSQTCAPVVIIVVGVKPICQNWGTRTYVCVCRCIDLCVSVYVCISVSLCEWVSNRLATSFFIIPQTGNSSSTRTRGEIFVFFFVFLFLFCFRCFFFFILFFFMLFHVYPSRQFVVS